MRRLLRLALPLGLLAALVIPTSAFAQSATSTNNVGGLALLASSPTALENVGFSGDTNSSATITNVTGIDIRALSFGDAISGPGIPAPASVGITSTAWTNTQNVATITTAAPHGLAVGNSIKVEGVLQDGYNGDWTVATVPSATTFTYSTFALNLTASSGGTVTTGPTQVLAIGSAASALIDPAGTNNSITWAAQLPGTAGNAITVTYNAPAAASSPLGASIAGDAVTINLATDASSVVTTTGTLLIAAVNGGFGEFAAVKSLLSATASGTVTGVLAANPSTPLTGGADNTITLNKAATATASGVALSASHARRNTDLAFWGNTLVQGDTRGLRIFNISNPASPALLSDFSCNGAYGDVSIWENLVFRSVDVPQTTDACAGSMDQYWKVTGGNHTATAQSTVIGKGFEGIRIIDISNPSAPSFVKGIATDCGSFTHTVVPDVANGFVYLYVSSFPNAAIDASPTAYDNTCEQYAAGSPAAPAQVSGHDKISIIRVPIANPSAATKISEVTLGLKGYNSYFNYLPGYTGDYNNTPGYKGCHDISVYMPTHTAAAACVTEGVTLNITNPAAPTVQQHFENPDIDRCATGVFRWVSSTQATTPNCMWSSATFTWDGNRIIWGALASGLGGCNSAQQGDIATSCNQNGATNVGVDRFYDGQSVTNECETGEGTAPVRSPVNRGAFWMNNSNDASWPISQFKIPFDVLDPAVDRYDRLTNQGCSASLGNVVPVNGKYVLPLSWHTGGIDAVDWTNSANPTELGWYDVDTGAMSNSNQRSNAWASYWYNGNVYVSNEAPQYGSFSPAGSRGLEVFALNDASVAGAFDLPHLNPQTQEMSFTCVVKISGSPKVGIKRTIKATVKVMGQLVRGASVRAQTYGYKTTKTTGANGVASFTFKPKKAVKLNITVAGQPNMTGCKAAKAIAKRR